MGYITAALQATIEHRNECRDLCFGEQMKWEVKQNNRRRQCSLSAATTCTGHAGLVHVPGSEKVKETKWLLGCLLKCAEIRPLLQRNSMDGSDLNPRNNQIFSQALERTKNVCWWKAMTLTENNTCPKGIPQKWQKPHLGTLPPAPLFRISLLRCTVQEICPLWRLFNQSTSIFRVAIHRKSTFKAKLKRKSTHLLRFFFTSSWTC